MNNQIPAFKNSNLVIGDPINGFSAIRAEKICYGQRPVGPLGDKAIVTSRRESIFTGPLYHIYTESFTNDIGEINHGRDDNDSMFDAYVLGNQVNVFKVNPVCGSPNTFSINRVRISELLPGDLMLSFPSYIPLAGKSSVNISIEEEIRRGMVIRVSAINEKKLVNAPTVALSFHGQGVILDGLAVTSQPNPVAPTATIQ